jgi:hypothetical protein
MTNIETQTTAWRVAQIFYNEPWEYMLTRSIRPFSESILKTGIVERFFWERSFDPQPNIKLYFRANIEKITELLEPNLIQHFKQFQEDRPSLRTTEALFADSVQFYYAEPFPDSFGGIVGASIAERHAQASSEIVLFFLEKFYNPPINNWNLANLLTTAIELHLGFCNAARMTTEEACQFLEFCMVNQPAEALTIQKFETYYLKQKEPLVNFHSEMWNLLQSGEVFEERPYNRWLEESYFTVEDFKKSFYNRALNVPSQLNALWAIYHKLIQQTNNRLGLFGKNEQMVYYLMVRSMEDIRPKNLLF